MDQPRHPLVAAQSAPDRPSIRPTIWRHSAARASSSRRPDSLVLSRLVPIKALASPSAVGDGRVDPVVQALLKVLQPMTQDAVEVDGEGDALPQEGVEGCS